MENQWKDEFHINNPIDVTISLSSKKYLSSKFFIMMANMRQQFDLKSCRGAREPRTGIRILRSVFFGKFSYFFFENLSHDTLKNTVFLQLFV